jgi:hypothetical protein
MTDHQETALAVCKISHALVFIQWQQSCTKKIHWVSNDTKAAQDVTI